MARKMGGGGFPARLVNLLIVLNWLFRYICVYEKEKHNIFTIL
jgi:hypothetical protein